MSRIDVTSLESTGQLSANAITAGNTTVNSVGIFLSKTESDYSGVISASAIIVGETDQNYTMSAEFNNSSDSYTALNATITNFDTYIRLTATATDPTFESPTFSHFGTTIGKIVIKIRRISGSGWDGSIFYSTAGHGFSESYKWDPPQPTWNGTDWAYIQLDANQLFAGGDDFITNTITKIRFDFGTTSADVFEIDYIRYYPINIIKPVVTVPSINVGGTSYSSLFTETVNTQIFTNPAVSNFWTKPSWATTGNELVIVHMWGGGGGAKFNSPSSGGGGGAFVFGYFKSSQVNATCNVVVGAGGVGSGTANGTQGGNSIFYANTTNLLTAYGGGGARGGIDPPPAGGGGGWLSAGIIGTGGDPLGGASSGTPGDSTFGGGGGATTTGLTVGGRSVYGGGGGGRASGAGGASIFGGGGGASGIGAGGTSVYGGTGGGGSTLPTTPGGGGGGSATAGVADGARGEVRVYTLRITGP